MTLFKSPTRFRVEQKIRELEITNNRLKVEQMAVNVSFNPVKYFKFDNEIFHNKIRIEALKSVL
jgi:hypothetical protein